ncbi:MAG: hypothetical protein Devi2KO_26310 [Devosia indica]
MVIFLFIAIVYIQPLAESQQKVRDIAVTWKQSETQIFDALEKEFRDDLRVWQAELDPLSLEIRFTAPDPKALDASRITLKNLLRANSQRAWDVKSQA